MAKPIVKRSRLRFEPLERRRVLGAGPLIISEILALNGLGITDADGDNSDWIEIHNPTDTTVNLDGWYLTDDAAELTKWRLPAVSVIAGEQLVVFASGKDRPDGPWEEGAELHTNFKLDSDGEYVALVRSDGTTVSHEFSPQFPRQRADVSYGISQEAAAFSLAAERLSYLVPQAAHAAWETTWMQGDFDDSAFSRYALPQRVLITEAGTFDPDFIEIQNLSGRTVDTSGWLVAANNADDRAGSADINAFHSTLWELTAEMPDGEVLYRSDIDDGSGNYWGSNIFWRTSGPGWVMLIDDVGAVADFVVWGYSLQQIASLDATIGGHHVTAADVWHGAALASITGSDPVSFQRIGVADHDDASDFALTAAITMGAENHNLTAPFSGRGTPGIGFETSPPGLAEAVEIDVAAEMLGNNTSIWTRIPFYVDDPSTFDTMQLRIKYNDGFVAYLGGQEVARRNAPDELYWDSAATAARSVEDSLEYQRIELSGLLGLLKPGANVFAVQGLNFGPPLLPGGDGNFLVLAELAATSARYFDPPTPGEPNGIGFPGFVKDTRFSVDRGFFEQPFQVEITTATPGAEIYYTTDGSPPSDTHGVLYTGPIAISTTTMVRAVALKQGWGPTNVDTQTYIFPDDVIRQPANPPGFPSTWGAGIPADYEMDPDVTGDPLYSGLMLDSLRTHPTISLVMDPPDLWDSARGIYANTREEGPAWEREVSIELIDFPAGDDAQVDAGIRIQGNASRQPSRPKHNMRLVFRKQYGLGKLEYPLFGDTQVQRFNDIVLRGGNGDSWFHPNSGRRPQAQYTHDQWHKATQVAMGQPGSQQCDAHLYINGLYWGFYHVIERPDASYMEEHFGGEFEDYDVLQHKGGTVDGNRQAWNQMMALLRGSDLRTDQAYQQARQYIDPVAMADWMLLNFYSANTDWDHNNWYGGRKRELGQTWKFFSWDAEVTFRSLTANITGVRKDDQPSEAHQLLSVNSEYKMTFADRAHKHLFNDGVLTPQATARDWMARAAQIETALVAESARWADHHRPADPYTVEHEFRARQNWFLSTWFPQRTGLVIGQLVSRGMYPSVDAPVFRVNGAYRHGGLIGPDHELTMPGPGTVYYTLDGSDPRLPGGGVSDDALVFDGDPITLARSAVVKSRARRGGEWSALNEAQFFVHRPASIESLVVTELNYDPYDPTPDELAVDPLLEGEDFEFIELANRGQEVISLSGVKFALGIDFEFTHDLDEEVLFPGEHVVLAGNPAAYQLRYPAAADPAGQYTGKLRNEGESLRLLAASGEPIFHFAYDNGGGWPGRAAGKGASLELIDPAAVPSSEPQQTDFLEDDANWRSSSEYGGSPGSRGTGPVDGVLVNEVLSHPVQFSRKTGPQADAIELHNVTAEQLDLGGWYLSDSWGWDPTPGGGNYKKFCIPDDTIVPPYGYVVFDERDFNPSGGVDPHLNPLDFSLDGDRSGDVWLMEADASGHLVRFVDHVEFGAAAEGESWGRWPDGQGDPYPMLRPTLERSQPHAGHNSGPRVGPVVLSELHYNPEPLAADNDLEFVEIYNATRWAVDLTDWRIRGGIDYDFPDQAVLEAYSVLVVVPFELDEIGKLAAFRQKYGIDETVELLGGYSGQLSDNGERVELQRPNRRPEGEPESVPHLLEDQVRYGSQDPWPAEADGGGQSLHRTETGAWGNLAASFDARPPSPGTTQFTVPVQAEVVARHVFYNNSIFDGDTPGPAADDDHAVAPDKAALLPGGTATFANYTSFTGGINGVMIDVAGMPELAMPDADDFRFRVGNDDDPANWAAAPVPSMFGVRPGQGQEGSDRVTIIWADGAVQKQWLQVTVLPTATTGLPEPDVCYFGNAIGETGNSPGDAKVGAIDMLGARDNQRGFLNPAGIDFAYDFNRDQRVNSSDMLIARNNQTHFLNALRLITVPPAAKDAVPGGKAAAGDAVLAAWADRESPPRPDPADELAWLRELEPTGTRGSAGRNAAEAVIDELMASDRP